MNKEELIFVKRAESIGSGFHKMINGWDQHYGLKPSIEGDFDYYKITFPGIITHKTREKTREKLIDLIKSNPKITTGELAKELGITVKGVEWNINKLKKEGGIKRIGPDKGGHWEVVRK